MINPLDSDIIAVGGQSNGASLRYWSLPRFANVAVSGSSMLQWQKGDASGYYAALANYIGLQFPTKRLVLYWVHGETDALVMADADAYAVRFQTFLDDLVADFPGYSFRTVVSLLNSTGTRPFVATVRAAQQTVVAANGYAYGVDFDDLPLPDGVHFDAVDTPARQWRMDGARKGIAA